MKGHRGIFAAVQEVPKDAGPGKENWEPPGRLLCVRTEETQSESARPTRPHTGSRSGACPAGMAARLLFKRGHAGTGAPR